MSALSAYLDAAQERAEFALALESPGLVRDQSLEVLALVAALREVEGVCEYAEEMRLPIPPSAIRRALSSLTPDTGSNDGEG